MIIVEPQNFAALRVLAFHGDSGTSTHTTNRRVKLRNTHFDGFHLWINFPNSFDNFISDMFQQTTRLFHSFCHFLIYHFVIYSIAQSVMLCGFQKIGGNDNVYRKLVTNFLFFVRSSMIGKKLYSFKRYSVIEGIDYTCLVDQIWSKKEPSSGDFLSLSSSFSSS